MYNINITSLIYILLYYWELHIFAKPLNIDSSNILGENILNHFAYALIRKMARKMSISASDSVVLFFSKRFGLGITDCVSVVSKSPGD